MWRYRAFGHLRLPASGLRCRCRVRVGEQMTLRRLSGLSGAVVAVTLLAGAVSCGSGSGNDGVAACTGPGVTVDQVRLGMVLSDSGPGSDAFSSARAGVNARLGVANAAGGVNGRRITYEWRDDTSSQLESNQVAQDLVKDGVFGLLPVTTVFGDALESLKDTGVPVVGFASLSTWARYQNFFSYGYVVDPTAIARYIQQAGGSKVGFVMTGSVDSALQTAQEYRDAFERFGLRTTETVPYVHGVDSPNQTISKLIAADADTIIGFTVPTDLAELVVAARNMRMNLKSTVSLVGYDQSQLPTVGRDLAGVSFDVHFRPFESSDPAIESYRAAMAKYSPETQPAQQFAMLGYIYADMFVKGLEQAGTCPTRQSFMTGLRAVHDYNAGGLIETLDFATNASVPLSCYAFVRINATGTDFEMVNERLCGSDTGGQ
ncbi:ABC transporter substrate-binding protein [Parafrankia sp. EUN1f]|uniref:ABC transporter substrate-binding protein n=1 Tax=Parafrankia sp. EUN1f TaxID=102897 RepID=UPI001E42BD95|nr:ABC transporter substrate-binding protein [Parafrankia sp. EUN1f]